MNQKEQLNRLERQMIDEAFAIGNIYDKAKQLDNVAANNMLRGVIQYLEDKGNALELALLAEEAKNWQMGLCTPDEYASKIRAIKS